MNRVRKYDFYSLTGSWNATFYYLPGVLGLLLEVSVLFVFRFIKVISVILVVRVNIIIT
jgi:hypothetical protein